MKWDLAELMKKALEKNRDALRKTAFAPLALPLGIEAATYLGTVLTLWVGKQIFDSVSVNKDMTIEDFISELEIENEKKELLRKEVKRVISESKAYNYKITNKDLIEHILFYIDSEVMFQISPNKDFKLPSLTDNRFDLKSLMNPDKDEDEDPKREHQIHFIKVRSEYAGRPRHYIYIGFLRKEEAQAYFENFYSGLKKKGAVYIANMPLNSETSKANIKSHIKCEDGDVVNVFEYGGDEKSVVPFPEVKGSQLVLSCTSTDKLIDNFYINC